MTVNMKDIGDSQDIPAGHIARAVEEGYLDHWLLAGPYPEEAEGIADAESNRAGAADFMAWRPAEGAAVRGADGTPDANRRGLWQAIRCAEDHLGHLDVIGGLSSGGRAWLFTIVHYPQSLDGTLLVTHSQTVTVRVNGARHVCDMSGPDEVMNDGADAAGNLHTTPMSVQLKAGQNEIWIYTSASQPGRWLVGAQLHTHADDGESSPHILLPTTLEPIERREKVADITAEAYLEQDVFQAKSRIWVKWPATSQLYDNLTVRLQAPNRRIYAEGYIEAAAGAKIPVAWPEQLPDGRYDVVLMPKPDEYYEKKLRIARRIPLQTVRNTHSTVYYGDYSGRAQEALVDAAKRKGLFAEIARMALDMWDKVDDDTLRAALDAVQDEAPGWRWLGLGLVGMHLHFGDAPDYRAEHGAAVKSWCQALAARDGGQYAPEPLREDETLAALTLTLLAQQIAAGDDPAHATTASATSASAGTLVEWLTTRARWGFALWDSPVACERIVAALSHLVELAQDEDVVDLAAVLLDKIFLGLGVNSCLGVFGGAHAETAAHMILNPGMDATSGLTRLAWGKGTFTPHILGTVSLACAKLYTVPEIIAATAVDESTPMVSRERHAAGGADSPDAEVHKITHRTATGMLSAALDYRAGRPGRAEHVWQATLGPGAVVFVNHPTCAADGPPTDEWRAPVAGPGFWRGNGILPRVAQADDVLAAWYRVPESDRMGFIHAYFPCREFDEYAITDHWAFARKGSGYVALYAATGLSRILHGNGAYRELRAYGAEQFWLCRLGSATQDGSFQEFRATAEAATITTQEGTARVVNAWGRDITFGWEGPFLVGATGAPAEEQPLRFVEHYAGTYAQAALPADTLEVDYQGHGLRLTFGAADG